MMPVISWRSAARVGWARHGHLDRTGRVCLEEYDLMRRESACLPQSGPNHPGRARLSAAVWAMPFQEHVVGHKALDRIGQIGKPGATAILAIGKNLQTNVALQPNRLQHGTVLCLTQCVEPETPLGIGRTRLQKCGWSQ